MLVWRLVLWALPFGEDHWFKEFCAVLAAPDNPAIAINAHLWMQGLIFSQVT